MMISKHHWVGKLFHFNFTIEYKPGVMNMVANTLLRLNTN
jgi:hypothetical protein